MTIKIIPNEKGNPPGKLADVELHFTEGGLEGLKLLGFAIWDRALEAATSRFPQANTASMASDGRLHCCGQLPMSRLRTASAI